MLPENTEDQDGQLEVTDTGGEEGLPDGDQLDAADASEGPAPTPTPKGQRSNRGVQMIPTTALAKLKADERERGKRMIMDDLNADAKAAGFKDYRDMMRAVAKGKDRKVTAEPALDDEDLDLDVDDDEPALTPTKKPNTSKLSMMEKQIAELTADKRRLNRGRARLEKQTRQLQRDLEKGNVERQLERAAIKAGVRDVDYSITLLKRRIKGKTAEELQNFDEAKYFSEELRSSHPYLYEAEVEPATTGPSGNAAAAPPKAAPASTPKPGNGATDARDLPRAEFDKLLEKHGLQNPALLT